jgi:hypothetical protein
MAKHLTKSLIVRKKNSQKTEFKHSKEHFKEFDVSCLWNTLYFKLLLFPATRLEKYSAIHSVGCDWGNVLRRS